MSARLHLFELEDQAWFPARLRDLMTDVLGAMQRSFGVHETIADILQPVLEQAGAQHVVDLCSGAGGLVPRVRKALLRRGCPVSVLFTDRYPNRAALERVCAREPAALRYYRESVDVTSIPEHLPGFRTLFASFHHFRPPEAQAILASAQRARAPIAVFEITERSWIGLFRAALTPLACWLTTPHLRPRTLERLLLTYVLPIVPIALTWDAVVSNLRTYTPAELIELTDELPSNDYSWRVGKLRGSLGQVTTYLLGVPAPAAASTTDTTQHLSNQGRDNSHVAL